MVFLGTHVHCKQIQAINGSWMVNCSRMLKPILKTLNNVDVNKFLEAKNKKK
uniref:Uncharacterized protein n=1 Tax=Rhizophora mucronata TaxID=61149 RepID=A0A2P2NLD4_RHIMU